MCFGHRATGGLHCINRDTDPCVPSSLEATPFQASAPGVTARPLRTEDVQDDTTRGYSGGGVQQCCEVGGV
jgi:hypothetical protein